MKAIEILNCLNEFAPFSTAAPWDNPGFTVGDKNAEITKCVVGLDVTDIEINQAVKQGAQLIVSHHPTVFHPQKDFLSGNVCFEAAKNGIALIAAHTNLDKAKNGVNDTLCEVLGLDYEKMPEDISEGFLNVGTLPGVYSPEQLAEHIGKKLHAAVRYIKTERKITKIGVCSGAGSDMCRDAAACGCNAFITGDAAYHDFLEADKVGVTLFAAGHYETEVIIVERLIKVLSTRFPEITFIPSERTNPIQTVVC